VMSAGKFLPQVGLAGAAQGSYLGGQLALDHGAILSSMGLAAFGVALIERRFRIAGGWALALAVLSFFGLIHAWNIHDVGQSFMLGIGVGWNYAIPYLVLALILFALAPRVTPLEEPMEDEESSQSVSLGH
jgi:hypothetical protein